MELGYIDSVALLWRDGKKLASMFVEGDVRTSSKALDAGPELLDAHRRASEVNWTKRRGIVCFITVSGFLNRLGFQGMRARPKR